MNNNSATYKGYILLGLMVAIIIILGTRTIGMADVTVGDVIDASNWQKAQGMTPEFMLEYLKKGWIKITIGKLNYDPSDVWFQKEGEKRNKGKYDVTDNGELIDKATRVIDPMDFVGIPFPNSELNPKDPKMAVKWFYNSILTNTSGGSHRMSATLSFVGEKFERKISGPQKGIKFITTEVNMQNQKFAAEYGKGIQEIFVMQVTDPYELNGLATMSYQYMNNTPDKVFAYVPASKAGQGHDCSSEIRFNVRNGLCTG